MLSRAHVVWTIISLSNSTVSNSSHLASQLRVWPFIFLLVVYIGGPTRNKGRRILRIGFSDDKVV